MRHRRPRVQRTPARGGGPGAAITCRSHGISRERFFTWRRRYEAGALSGAPTLRGRGPERGADATRPGPRAGRRRH
ncbi:transposase [Streptomyces luteogriseus]|uniref:transposase n=1 Tax=Streptomyces luteogriseus TaxID=68233 RepID=UPI00371BD00F